MQKFACAAEILTKVTGGYFLMFTLKTLCERYIVFCREAFG